MEYVVINRRSRPTHDGLDPKEDQKMRSQAISVTSYPGARLEITEASGPFRGALRALLGRRAAVDVDAATGLSDDTAPRLASSFENRVRRMRANAHAAYRSVNGDPEAALDAALAVIEAEWHATRAERDSFGEALKSIRLYAQDRRARALAERALDSRSEPATIHGARSGARRFPFEDEFDA
jgi:hypothetical protein